MSLKSNSFVAAAEHVCLQPVLEHRQRRGRRNISRTMGTKCICVCLQCFDAVENRVERSADLHMVQLMPLPLTVSCFSKIQIGFAFLVPAHPGSPGQRAVKRV